MYVCAHVPFFISYACPRQNAQKMALLNGGCKGGFGRGYDLLKNITPPIN